MTTFPCSSKVVNGRCKVISECPRRKHSGISWPRTLLGATRITKCPFGSNGTATRKCDGKESWLPPDLSNCTGHKFYDLEGALKNLQTNKTQLNSARYEFDCKGNLANNCFF